MLDGELLQLLTAAQYLISQIGSKGNTAQATSGDLTDTGLPFTLPVTLDKLLEYVENRIKEIYFEIKRLIGKAYWDSIIESFDDTMTDYMSRKFDKGPKP